MGLLATLKWLWDPRSEEDKRYVTDPLRRYTQNFVIYIKGVDTPFERYVEFEDANYGDWYIRVDIDDDVREWLNKRAKNGIKLDDVWYPPNMIERIEVGNVEVTDITE